MSDLNRVKIAKASNFLIFWVPTIYLYLNAQGYSLEQGFTLIAFLQIATVLLEYPTGVIGDVYGHNFSLILGFISLILSNVLLGLSLQIPYHLMFLLMLVSAAGNAFISGSDSALLNSVSKDYKKDSAENASLAGIFLFVSTVLGGFIGSIDLRLPFLLGAVSNLFALYFTFSIKSKSKGGDSDSSIMSTALLGIKESVRNLKILFPIMVTSVIGMYILSEKYVLVPVFEQMNMPVAFFGLFSAIVMAFRYQSALVYKKFGTLNYNILIALFLLSTLLISFKYYSLLGLALVYGLGGYINLQSDIIINEHVKDSVRASVLSFRNLLIRVLGTPYLWLIGFLSGYMSFQYVNIYMTVVLSVLLIIVAFLYKWRFSRNNDSI